MKKEQRKKWLMLNRIELPERWRGFVHLCGWCKYCVSSGNNCMDCNAECEFPVEKIGENMDTPMLGGDCWGFRPRYRYEDAVDAVGLFLQGKYPDMSNCKKKVGK